MTTPTTRSLHPVDHAQAPDAPVAQHAKEALRQWCAPEVAQDRFARKIVAGLDESTDELSVTVEERLSLARARALQQARTAHLMESTQLSWKLRAQDAWGEVQAFMGKHPFWTGRLATAMSMAVVVLGLMHIDETAGWLSKEFQTAEVDAALLSDELPPDAYQDAGFAEFIQPRED